MSETNTQEPGFYGLGIAPKLLEILHQQKYHTPTPIQRQAIPIAVEGKDVMGIAQTGTGKTLAFGIPLIQRLAQGKGVGLVILPTRELALQVEESLTRIGRSIGLRTAVLIGGASMHLQMQAIKRNPHVFIATPGRLIDHLDQRTIKLDQVSVMVLDEADRMLDMGFKPQIERILKAVPSSRQTMLFSATMPKEIVNIANAYMHLPVRVEIAKAGTASSQVTQEAYMVRKEDKLRLLEKVLTEYHGSVLVFSRTKHHAKKITRAVRDMGHPAAEIHANRSLGQRREALDGFSRGKYRVLVATDIASRGIDVKEIELVINFDLPDQTEDYVHRIGRTGRAGHHGHAISFVTPDQRRDVKDIERLIRAILPMKTLPELPPQRAMAPSTDDERPSRSSRPSRFGRSSERGHRFESRESSRSFSGGYEAGASSERSERFQGEGRRRFGGGGGRSRVKSGQRSSGRFRGRR